MLKLLDRVANHGPPRNTDISHQVGHGLWEFIQGRLRVLWFYDEGRLIICSHGFVKKRQKTPPGELEKARDGRRRYLAAKMRNDIQFEG